MKVRILLAILALTVLVIHGSEPDPEHNAGAQFCENHALWMCSYCGPPDPSCLDECFEFCMDGGSCSPEWCYQPSEVD